MLGEEGFDALLSYWLDKEWFLFDQLTGHPPVGLYAYFNFVVAFSRTCVIGCLTFP
eukprot:c23713_g2_i1 orf=196-363(-)